METKARLILICLWLVAGTASAGNQDSGFVLSGKTGQLELQRVVELGEVEKEDLFLAAQEWIAKSFRKYDAVVQLANLETGTIIVRGVMENLNFGPVPTDAGFDLILEFRAGRYRATVTAVQIPSQLPPFLGGDIIHTPMREMRPYRNEKKKNLERRREIDRRFLIVLSQLAEYLRSSDDADDW